MTRRPEALHWLPQADTESPITACGLNIDAGYGLAWTRSRDLASYQGRPYESWPPPCLTCEGIARDLGDVAQHAS